MKDKPKSKRSQNIEKDTPFGAFSLNTLSLCRGLVDQWGGSRKYKFFQDIGLDKVWRRTDTWGRSMPYRVSEMFNYVLTHNKSMFPDVIKEIVRVEWHLTKTALQFQPRPKPPLQVYFNQTHPALVSSFKKDGYQLLDGEITPISKEALRKIEEGIVDRLKQGKFDVALTHYEQAWENYVFSRWEAANAQLRSFLEEVFNEIARRLYPREVQRKESGDIRKLLVEKGFIEDEDVRYIGGLFSKLSFSGSHPGLSNEDKCRARYTVVSEMADHYLKKYLSM